jgi:hypothetical protein
MRPTKRLTAVVSKPSTVRMIDELSLNSHTRVTAPFWDKGSELDGLAAIVAPTRHHLDARGAFDDRVRDASK